MDEDYESEMDNEIVNSMTESETTSPKTADVKSLKELPFPNFSASWYEKQSKLIRIEARDEVRRKNPMSRDNENFIHMVRNRVEGSVEKNLETLQEKLKSCSSASKLVHYEAIYANKWSYHKNQGSGNGVSQKQWSSNTKKFL